MSFRNITNTSIVFFLIVLLLTSPTISYAQPAHAPAMASSAFDLINAVNALRASNGLPAYSISPILMFTAQNQANFMAANGVVTHSGPGGIGLTDRLLAAGYPLAGDLSLGGFRSENITGGSENKTAQSAVDQWTGDAPHLNTMISPDFTEIGAGVAVADGRVYYVIDAARPTTSGAPQPVTPIVGGGSDVPSNEAPVPVVAINTPNQAGDVIHEVLSGQTLWQIAIAYDVKIDDIKKLNNLFDNNIYPGDKLLIAKVANATETSTLTPLPTATILSISTSTLVPPSAMPTASMLSTLPDAAPDNSAVMLIMIGIIAVAILVGGLFTRFGNAKLE